LNALCLTAEINGVNSVGKRLLLVALLIVARAGNWIGSNGERAGSLVLVYSASMDLDLSLV
jgi:hypothetical protein